MYMTNNDQHNFVAYVENTKQQTRISSTANRLRARGSEKKGVLQHDKYNHAGHWLPIKLDHVPSR